MTLANKNILYTFRRYFGTQRFLARSCQPLEGSFGYVSAAFGRLSSNSWTDSAPKVTSWLFMLLLSAETDTLHSSYLSSFVHKPMHSPCLN